MLARLGALVAGLAFFIPVQSDLTFPEGAVVARAWDVARGQPPYHDWRLWPHAFSPYGPLTYYPAGWVASLVADAPHPRAVYLIGRIQSAIGLFLAAVSVVLMGRSLRWNWLWAVLPVGLWASWEFVFSYAISFRPDAPAAAFSMAALAVMLRAKPSLRAIAAVFALLSLAMWFKPAAWGMLATVACWIYWGAGARKAILALAVLAGVNFSAAVILNMKLDGRLFLNMIGSLDNGFMLKNWPDFYLQLPAESLLIFGLGAACLFIMWREILRRRKDPGSDQTPPDSARLIATAALGCWISASVLHLKRGADANYYLETYMLLCVCAVWGLRRMAGLPAIQNGLAGSAFAAVPLIFILALGAFGTFNGYTGLLGQLRSLWKPGPVETFLRDWGNVPILTTNPWVALAVPSPPTLLDHVQFGILVRRGKLPPKDLFDRIERAEFAFVLLPSDEWAEKSERGVCPGFMAAVSRRYESERRVGNLTVLRPRRTE